MIITGEVSGDLIGASLIGKLKNKNPDLHITGIGGDKMKSAGMDLIFHSDQMAFLGFVEVVRHLPFIHHVQKKLIEIIKQEKISFVVLIDYPGFNLSIARKLKKLGIKIIYYVSPQIWAWAKGRVKKVKRFVDKMLVVFPFEVDFYRTKNINAEYVGHPLVERISDYQFMNKDEFYSKFNLDKQKEILLVMPGSRKQEIKEIFPEIIKAANLVASKFDLQIIVARSKNIKDEYLHQLGSSHTFLTVSDHNFELMKYSRFGIIKSGTSTLEAGFFALPMIVVYKTSRLTYFIGRKLITLDRIGMVNILLDEMVAPELIQHKANSENIDEEAAKILSDEQVYAKTQQKLSEVSKKLGGIGASEKAANSILGIMNEA